MRVLWIGKTGDANAWYHIHPFVASKHTTEITVVRTRPPTRAIPSHKVRWVPLGEHSVPGLAMRYVGAGARELTRGRYDLMVSFGVVPWGVLAWTLSAGFGVPLLLGLIGTDFHDGVRGDRGWGLVRRVLGRADWVTVPGAAMARELERITGRSAGVSVVPHCPPAELLAPRLPPTPRSCRLVTAGALSRNKGTIDVLRAVRDLRSSMAVHLDVLGEGEERPALEGFVGAEGLGDAVTFHGHVDDVAPFFDQATLFIQASRAEGLSLSLVEALARELIPVVTLAGSEEDLIENGRNGLFFSAGSVGDLVRAVRAALDRERFPKLLDGVRATKARLHPANATKAVEAIQEVLMERAR